MPTNGNTNERQKGDTSGRQPAAAPETANIYQEDNQYLIIVPIELHEQTFQALGSFGHLAYEIYNMAVLIQTRDGLLTRLGNFAYDYILAINSYLLERNMEPLLDPSDMDLWTPQQMRELLTLSAYQFQFDWDQERVTWCRAVELDIEWREVLNHYQGIPTLEPE